MTTQPKTPATTPPATSPAPVAVTPPALRRPCAVAGLLSREIDDELVLVDPRDGEAYLLNPIGATILDLCDGRSTVAGIIAEISQTLGTPEAEVAPEVHKFVSDLAARGLLVEGDEA